MGTCALSRKWLRIVFAETYYLALCLDNSFMHSIGHVRHLPASLAFQALANSTQIHMHASSSPRSICKTMLWSLIDKVKRQSPVDTSCQGSSCISKDFQTGAVEQGAQLQVITLRWRFKRTSHTALFEVLPWITEGLLTAARIGFHHACNEG